MLKVNLLIVVSSKVESRVVAHAIYGETKKVLLRFKRISSYVKACKGSHSESKCITTTGSRDTNLAGLIGSFTPKRW